MPAHDRSPGARLYDGLASLKLSLSLFLTLAVTSMFGTLIQQQADPKAYVESYGPLLAGIFRALNLIDMYHSWWFETLLGLLLVNTLLCSLRRLPAALRSIRGEQFAPAEELKIKKHVASWKSEAGQEAVEAVLSRRGRFAVRDEGAGRVYFLQKGRWGRLGAYVCHASLVLFFLGGIVGARFGLKGFVEVPEGGSVDEIELRAGGHFKLPFEVRCEKFELQSYPDGRPKDYKSLLVVTRGGREVQRKTIEVNDPLIQDGIFFYQSSYGNEGQGAVLRVLTPEGRLVADGVRVPLEGAVRLPGTDAVVELLDSTGDFRGQGPAVQLTLLGASGGHSHEGEPFVLLQRMPALDLERGGALVFQLAGLLPGSPYTGLQVAKDPGVPFIWAGAVVLSVGTLLAFFVPHRRVWVRREGERLLLAGVASRNPAAFEEEFEALERELREATAAAAPPPPNARNAAG